MKILTFHSQILARDLGWIRSDYKYFIEEYKDYYRVIGFDLNTSHIDVSFKTFEEAEDYCLNVLD